MKYVKKHSAVIHMTRGEVCKSHSVEIHTTRGEVCKSHSTLIHMTGGAVCNRALKLHGCCQCHMEALINKYMDNE